MTPIQALHEAVDVLGGQTAVAKACGGRVRQQHVWNWLYRDFKIPAQYAPKIQKATAAKGKEIKASVLCPDVFDDDVAA